MFICVFKLLVCTCKLTWSNMMVPLQREGFSRFNKIYEFESNVLNQNCTMSMTSVSGHLLEFRFVGQYTKW